MPNYEVPADTGTNNVYDVTVRVQDNGSTRLQDTQMVVVTVNDVNETPVISGGATPSFAEIEFDVDGMPDLTDRHLHGTPAASKFYDDDGHDVTWERERHMTGTTSDITKNSAMGRELSFKNISPGTDLESPPTSRTPTLT